MAVSLGVVGALAGAFLLGVIVVASVQALQARELDSLSQAAWLLFIFCAPLLGAVAWFIVHEHRVDVLLARWGLGGAWK